MYFNENPSSRHILCISKKLKTLQSLFLRMFRFKNTFNSFDKEKRKVLYYFRMIDQIITRNHNSRGEWE